MSPNCVVYTGYFNISIDTLEIIDGIKNRSTLKTKNEERGHWEQQFIIFTNYKTDGPGLRTAIRSAQKPLHETQQPCFPKKS